ncbi:MAG: CDP-diacylglycerol--serine O-phosphatidyltransferase [Rikenellaceae bacterium]|nr:CDP-diacylglycerol--serine O-phosphatidyltransferase [Rikenellaceae bacterium]
MKFKLFSIPNIITSLNLMSGCISIVFAFKGDFLWSFLMIIIAAGFDFFDGLTARALKQYSEIGKQLDSLADIVSFGAAPSFTVYCYLSHYDIGTGPVVYTVFILTAFSALRLAKFNLDTRQSEEFIGLPTPANAIFFSSLIFTASSGRYGFVNALTDNFITIFILVIIFSLLLISEIRMFSLKFKDLSIRNNFLRYAFVIFSVSTVLLWDITAIPVIILAYIITSAAKNGMR